MSRLHGFGVGMALALVLAGCVSAPVPGTVTPVPVPTFRCTPEAGGAEFDCSRTEHEAMVAQEALWQEAEAVYRKFLAEEARIMRAGGIREPSEVLLSTTTGAYLDDVMNTYRGFLDNRIVAKGEDPTLRSFQRVPGRTKPGALLSANTCVDLRSFEFVEGDESLGPGPIALDETYFGMADGRLKIVGADGKEVEKC